MDKREVSDVGMAERLSGDTDSEAREKADMAKSFLDMGEMAEWFVKATYVYPDGRIEVRWNFGDEMK